MNGPEHYREAERLLTRPRREEMDGVTYVVEHPTALHIAEAQVHATLALVAVLTSGPWRRGVPVANLPEQRTFIPHKRKETDGV